MSDLSTSYLGLKLKNPLVAAASGLTNSPEKVEKLQEAGVGAVVYHSLFEEEIRQDLKCDIAQSSAISSHPEALPYTREMAMELKPEEYLSSLTESRKRLSIPLIASLNCQDPTWWIEYAERIEATGVAALELNASIFPAQTQPAKEIEKSLIKSLRKVRENTTIPLAVKLGYNYTSLPNLVHQIEGIGIQGCVLFNRFYRPDIDIDSMRHVAGGGLSTEVELSETLRWVGVLSGELECDLAAATGVHSGKGAVKALLAGAAVCQLCSAIYRGGPSVISSMLREITEWMQQKKFYDLASFRGKLSTASLKTKKHWQRQQYLKAVRPQK